MSIDYTPKLMVGWKVEEEELKHWFDEDGYLICDEWEQLDPVAETCANVLGVNGLYGYDLVCEVNSVCCDEGYVVGVPLDHGKPVPIEEFMRGIDGIEGLANDVWREVMRCDPPSRPNVIAFTRVW